MKVIENRKKYFILSLLVILAGIAVMIMNFSAGNGALNWDIEFIGGTAIKLDMGKEVENDEIAAVIEEVTGQNSPQIQQILGSNQVSIRMQTVDSDGRVALLTALKEKFGLTDDNVLGVSDVSGTISKEMKQSAIKATLIACAAMLVYISIRFKDLRAGCSAIIALVHDILVVLAAYAIFRIPVNNAFIAVLLTILGYSINSTIVIFDRVRENASKFVRKNTHEKINKSISQTLARSVNTSLTTLFTIGAIYVFGVQSIKEFALPMIVGIISGAYSSIFISGSVWYMLLPDLQKK